MRAENQARILAAQKAYETAAKALDHAVKAKAPPEELKRLKDVADAREAEYEQTIDLAMNDN